ncbi:cobQ/CobB/MinD/ParA nucleotide binding domain protein (plasmid) [Yersinia pestis]|uniref:Conjugal transfer protein n=1 Tax=Yersinia pestis Java 9 TaxID=880632 RepID=E8PSF9_YERPE|nr:MULTISPECIES: conjugal transfer protein [Enterobacterales]EDQ2484939.1 conjugal transfer protein, TraL family [Salmonella enterica subsp. enterica serovar Oranienburg]EDX0932731.1 conjugal transfer protein, TraL family [Salmonella enterica subsp. enterica]ADW66959.1 conjugal transfer protein [Yersinia pestis Java 9]AJJ37987.1 cobQ/CobB/MinD/ParA nucleotide binding domain protein [Yersinia pestis]MDL1250225.1 conjugal transfer protein TraL [Yersinia pestis]
MNNTAHLILQGKGGVGKSLVSSMLAQYLLERSYTPICGDTDPVNTTFYQIKGLDVALVPITEGGTVVQRLFDPLFESIISAEHPVVVDNGASTFLPMLKFLKSNLILETLEQFGKQTYIHTIITGGQAKDDTANGLIALIDMIKESGTKTKVVVWKNEFWGTPFFDGKSLEDMPWIKKNGDIIEGIVSIVDRNSDAFSTDIKIMTENHMTYNEVKESEKFGLIAKSRVFRVFNDVYQELDAVFNKELHHE